MTNGQTRGINFSDIRVNINLEEHLEVLTDEVSTNIICDEYTTTQAWSAATALATIVIEVINTGSPHFRSKNGMAPKVRRYCALGYFDRLDDEFLTDHSSQHIRENVSEGNGTHAFNFLKQKGYISHISGYDWVVSPRTMEICNSVAERLRAEVEAPSVAVEDEGTLGPAAIPRNEDWRTGGLRRAALAELRVVYTYRGSEISKDIYYQLEEDGLSDLLDVEFRDRQRGGTVDIKKLLLSLLDGEA